MSGTLNMNAAEDLNRERRITFCLYEQWERLAGKNSLPALKNMNREDIAPFKKNLVLLDLRSNREEPTFQVIGQELQEDLDVDLSNMPVSSVPRRTMLSRITDHYKEVLANRVPIAFEAEFVNRNGEKALYRGILLPFSDDNQNINFILGGVRWILEKDVKLDESKPTIEELMMSIAAGKDDGEKDIYLEGPDTEFDKPDDEVAEETAAEADFEEVVLNEDDIKQAENISGEETALVDSLNIETGTEEIDAEMSFAENDPAQDHEIFLEEDDIGFEEDDIDVESVPEDVKDSLDEVDAEQDETHETSETPVDVSKTTLEELLAPSPSETEEALQEQSASDNVQVEFDNYQEADAEADVEIGFEETLDEYPVFDDDQIQEQDEIDVAENGVQEDQTPYAHSIDEKTKSTLFRKDFFPEAVTVPENVAEDIIEENEELLLEDDMYVEEDNIEREEIISEDEMVLSDPLNDEEVTDETDTEALLLQDDAEQIHELSFEENGGEEELASFNEIMEKELAKEESDDADELLLEEVENFEADFESFETDFEDDKQQTAKTDSGAEVESASDTEAGTKPLHSEDILIETDVIETGTEEDERVNELSESAEDILEIDDETDGEFESRDELKAPEDHEVEMDTEDQPTRLSDHEHQSPDYMHGKSEDSAAINLEENDEELIAFSDNGDDIPTIAEDTDSEVEDPDAFKTLEEGNVEVVPENQSIMIQESGYHSIEGDNIEPENSDLQSTNDDENAESADLSSAETNHVSEDDDDDLSIEELMQSIISERKFDLAYQREQQAKEKLAEKKEPVEPATIELDELSTVSEVNEDFVENEAVQDNLTNDGEESAPLFENEAPITRQESEVSDQNDVLSSDVPEDNQLVAPESQVTEDDLTAFQDEMVTDDTKPEEENSKTATDDETENPITDIEDTLDVIAELSETETTQEPVEQETEHTYSESHEETEPAEISESLDLDTFMDNEFGVSEEGIISDDDIFISDSDISDDNDDSDERAELHTRQEAENPDTEFDKPDDNISSEDRDEHEQDVTSETEEEKDESPEIQEGQHDESDVQDSVAADDIDISDEDKSPLQEFDKPHDAEETAGQINETEEIQPPEITKQEAKPKKRSSVIERAMALMSPGFGWKKEEFRDDNKINAEASLTDVNADNPDLQVGSAEINVIEEDQVSQESQESATEKAAEESIPDGEENSSSENMIDEYEPVEADQSNHENDKKTDPDVEGQLLQGHEPDIHMTVTFEEAVEFTDEDIFMETENVKSFEDDIVNELIKSDPKADDEEITAKQEENSIVEGDNAERAEPESDESDTASAETSEDIRSDESEVPAMETEGDELPLAELKAALKQVVGYIKKEDANHNRSRDALYNILTAIYDFHQTCEKSPEAYNTIVEEEDLKVQSRAPFTPVLKICLGKDYDKTRLTEYAAALGIARYMGIAVSEFHDFIKNFPGGIKGCVKEMRIIRKHGASGNVMARKTKTVEEARAILREMAPIASFRLKKVIVGNNTDEFCLLLAKRDGHDISVLKVLDDRYTKLDPILKRAAFIKGNLNGRK